MSANSRGSSRPMRFLCAEHGASAAEFALVVLVFVILVFAIIDFGRALWAWNQAEKATQIGVRFAAVNTIVATGLKSIDGVGMGIGNGNAIPVASITPNPVVCTAASCSGYGPVDAAAFAAIVAQMQNYFPQIAAANVIVEYQHVGFGFSGNPFGTDISPNVTVKLQNMVFNFVTPGLAGMVTIAMPSFAATLTGEDLAP